MNRKQRRALERKTGGKIAQNFSEKISQFGKLPEQCSTCEKAFDKKDREMLATWNVVVRQEAVRLFCPHCMNKAKQVIEQHGERNESRAPIVPGFEEDSNGKD